MDLWSSTRVTLSLQISNLWGLRRKKKFRQIKLHTGRLHLTNQVNFWRHLAALDFNQEYQSKGVRSLRWNTHTIPSVSRLNQNEAHTSRCECALENADWKNCGFLQELTKPCVFTPWKHAMTDCGERAPLPVQEYKPTHTCTRPHTKSPPHSHVHADLRPVTANRATYILATSTCLEYEKCFKSVWANKRCYRITCILSGLNCSYNLPKDTVTHKRRMLIIWLLLRSRQKIETLWLS